MPLSTHHVMMCGVRCCSNAIQCLLSACISASLSFYMSVCLSVYVLCLSIYLFLFACMSWQMSVSLFFLPVYALSPCLAFPVLSRSESVFISVFFLSYLFP